MPNIPRKTFKSQKEYSEAYQKGKKKYIKPKEKDDYPMDSTKKGKKKEISRYSGVGRGY